MSGRRPLHRWLDALLLLDDGSLTSTHPSGVCEVVFLEPPSQPFQTCGTVVVTTIRYRSKVAARHYQPLLQL